MAGDKYHAGKYSLFTVPTPVGYINVDEFHALNGCCSGRSALIADGDISPPQTR